MIREAWGVVYMKAGTEYGDWNRETYLAALAEARCNSPSLHFSGSFRVLRVARRSGLHGEAYGTKMLAEYKRRIRMGKSRVDENMEPEDQEPEVEKLGLWSRIFWGLGG